MYDLAILPGERVRGKHAPIATLLIIILNVAIYLYTSIGSESPLLITSYEHIIKYGFKPIYMLTQPILAISRAFTSMFIHADLFHILFNMYFLWIFGSRIEGFIGHGRFLLLYVLSGLSAIIFHIAITPIGGYDTLAIPAVGASGAISGVLGSYLLILPHTRLVVCMFFLLIPFCFNLPASAFLLLWFAQQVIYGYLRLGGVAYFAHVGGFVMGIMLTPIITKRILRKISYMDYIFKYLADYYGIYITRPRGIGTGTKTILILLFLAIIIGFLFGAYITRATLIYSMSVSVGSGIGNELQTDNLSLAIYDSKLSITTSPLDNVRILVNRLAPILYNISAADHEIVGTFRYKTIISGIIVDVLLMNVTLKYDENGVVTYSEGLMVTETVQIDRYGRSSRGKPVEFAFEINTISLDRSILISLCLIAISINLFAIPAVLKAEELAIYSGYGFRDLPFPHL